MMMKGLLCRQQEQPAAVVDDNMSNLTSASCEASASSTNKPDPSTAYSPQQYLNSMPAVQQVHPPALAKKKRNLPGNPDPEAEVIALSPKTLLATNRFVCEICSKGFQRDQNLQLHRRGHNLPWKLKQRSSKETRKKVYVCPEPLCVHHDPSRALGDLTGIKKHFCRKHGEKKWKCEKCSKRYAVQSDWKAHSKTCGTREYRCDCGTLFSRRDSFITHRAFCDALAEESARTITAAVSSVNPLLSIPPYNFVPNPYSQQSSTAVPPPPTPQLTMEQGFPLSPWLVDLPSPNPPPSYPSDQMCLPPSYTIAAPSPHMSATALLQKAAQMGASMNMCRTTSSSNDDPPSHVGYSGCSSRPFILNLSSCEEMAGAAAPVGNNAAPPDVAANAGGRGGGGGIVVGAGSGQHYSYMSMIPPALATSSAGYDVSSSTLGSTAVCRREYNGGNDGMTRDFLGLRALSDDDILNMTAAAAAGIGGCIDSSPPHHNHREDSRGDQKPWPC